MTDKGMAAIVVSAFLFSVLVVVIAIRSKQSADFQADANNNFVVETKKYRVVSVGVADGSIQRVAVPCD